MVEVCEKTVDKQGKTCIIVFVRRNTAGLCKGSTADSDSVCEGSNPSPAATLSGCNGKPLHPLFLVCRKTLRVFPTKGLRSAARIICPSVTDKFHTGSPSCIFSHAHVARENDFISLPPAGGKLCEAFLTRWTAGAFAPAVFYMGERWVGRATARVAPTKKSCLA